METINDRLRALRKALGLKQADLAKKIGIGFSAISQIETGVSTLTDGNILLICTPSRLIQGTTVNESWLRNGQGDMLLKDDGLPKLYDSNKNELPPEERELVAIFRELLDSNKKVLRETVRAALAIQKNTEGMYSESSDPASAVSERPPEYLGRGTEAVPFPERRTIDLPVWGKTAAGAPLGIGDFDPYDSTRPCDAGLVKGDAADYGWLKVKGNSMTEAGIDSGDWVLIRHTEKPEHGAIMLVRHENDITLKRIRIAEGEGSQEEVRMCWEDGSGKEARLDDDEYGIQGKFVHVDKQGQ